MLKMLQLAMFAGLNENDVQITSDTSNTRRDVKFAGKRVATFLHLCQNCAYAKFQSTTDLSQ